VGFRCCGDAYDFRGCLSICGRNKNNGINCARLGAFFMSFIE
jgi:hypothetical protein